MFIRTKDGRILEFDKLNEVSKLSIDMAEEPIKEADTIEELCDEFVIIRKEENLHTTLRNYSLEDLHILKDRQEHNCEVYGAIWTSKGLIYVAKMDSEGNLELI